MTSMVGEWEARSTSDYFTFSFKAQGKVLECYTISLMFYTCMEIPLQNLSLGKLTFPLSIEACIWLADPCVITISSFINFYSFFNYIIVNIYKWGSYRLWFLCLRMFSLKLDSQFESGRGKIEYWVRTGYADSSAWRIAKIGECSIQAACGEKEQQLWFWSMTVHSLGCLYINTF